jgi:hypothetical protein
VCSNFFWCFSADHCSDCFTQEIEERFVVEVVCSQDCIKQNWLVHFAKFGVPFIVGAKKYMVRNVAWQI